MLNKFYLQSGLDSSGDYLGDPKSMEQIQHDLLCKFDCRPEWPICLFDFTYKNKIPCYFSFKVSDNLEEFLIDGYFE